MTDDDVRGLLRELRNEPVPADSLARVRLRMSERLEARPRFWRFLLAAGGGAAAVLVVVLMLRPVPRTVAIPVYRPAEVAIIHESPAAKVVPPPVRPSHHRAAARKAKPKVSEEGVLVRIETEDPDVVILLLGG